MFGSLTQCHIAPNDQYEPLITAPWNALVCGHNATGWVWLVAIERLSPTRYEIKATYLPKLVVIGEETIAVDNKIKFDGPDGQSVTVTVKKFSGSYKHWMKLKVWVDVVGVYTQ